MKEQPLVSAIIPTFNRAKLVCETIDSVLAQTYPNIEIIVVDDGSSDNTEEVLKKYGNKVRYLKQDNKGNSAARNYGFKVSRGEYIGFLDDDDLWLPSKIEEEVKFLQDHSDLGFVYCGTYLIDLEGKITGQRTIWEEEDATFARLYRGNIIISPSISLIRRDCLKDVGYYDEGLYQSSDYDMWIRLARKYKFVYLDKILAKYRVHEKSLGRNLDRRLKLHVKIFNKPEISGDKTWLEKRIRIAQEYYDIGRQFYEAGYYLKAARCFLGAVLIYPFVGFYYWPKEIRCFRFSLIYRILKVYYLIVKSFFKQVVFVIRRILIQ
ncbi:MAG: hypothetical protein A2Z88_10335 [Omnitrophica WOR_2 bacterium GWA2_47_8]|nr:MAG: hypothetical protein A2Z88_10335 [Omnitrophica WOR_2 bacterium GWA2_47_8]